MSGSIALNGRSIAEQIGSQIFIDTGAIVCDGFAVKQTNNSLSVD